MTGPACSAGSSSDAPVCASLERAASAKISPLLHAWVTPAQSDWIDGRRTCGAWGHTADSAACRQFLQAACRQCSSTREQTV